MVVVIFGGVKGFLRNIQINLLCVTCGNQKAAHAGGRSNFIPLFGARGGDRTRTPFRAQHFKC